MAHCQRVSNTDQENEKRVYASNRLRVEFELLAVDQVLADTVDRVEGDDTAAQVESAGTGDAVGEAGK